MKRRTAHKGYPGPVEFSFAVVIYEHDAVRWKLAAIIYSLKAIVVILWEGQWDDGEVARVGQVQSKFRR